MNRIYALVLALFVASAQANSVTLKEAAVPEVSDVQPKLHDLGIDAFVNDYVDSTLYMILPFMQTNGLDPMELPDVEEGFEVRPILITYSAWLRIHNGYMTGLTNVERNGDQRVSYFAKMLRVRVSLQFRDLEFIYRYLVQVMNIGPTGGIVGSLNRFVVNVDILMDFNNDEIHLQEFSLTDIGRLRVRLTGNILTDWLVNPVIRVFTTIFDTIIMRVVQNNIHDAVNDVIAILNRNIADVIRYIESYNL